MSWFTNLVTKIKDFVDSPKLTAVEKEIEELLPAGITIMGDIATLAPNKTLTELNSVATKYTLPTVTELANGQTPTSVALSLGTQILQKNHAPAAAEGLLTTVIALAAQAVTPTPTALPAAA